MTASITRNTTYFTLALAVQKVLAFLYFWMISRALLPDQLGQYVFALSFSTIAAIALDLGLSPVLTREASKDPERANQMLRCVIGLKLPLTFLTFLGSWLVLLWSGKPADVRLLVYLATLVTTLDSFTFSFWVIFRARQTMAFESISTLIVQLIIFGLGILTVFSGGEVKWLIAGLLTASVWNLLFVSTLLVRRLGFSLRPAWDSQTNRLLLRLIPAFALSGIFLRIYNAHDSVLLSYVAGDAAVAAFAIPAKVVSSLQQIIPGAFAAVIFPSFSTHFVSDPLQLRQTFQHAVEYLLIISLPLTAGIVALTPHIIAEVWPQYTPIVLNFSLMALAIPFIFLAFPTGYLLNATDRQHLTTLNRGAITAAAVGLNLLLIPRLGYLGAGITYLATNIGLLLLDFWWVAPVARPDWKALGEKLISIGLATAVMFGLVVLLRQSLSIFIITPIAMVVYFAALISFGGIDRQLLLALKQKVFRPAV